MKHLKHHETLLKHCETSPNTLKFVIRCKNMGARCGDIGAWRGDIGARHGNIGARCGDIGTHAFFSVILAIAELV